MTALSQSQTFDSRTAGRDLRRRPSAKLSTAES